MQPLLGDGVTPAKPSFLRRFGSFFTRRWTGRILAASALVCGLDLLLSPLGFPLPEPLVVVAGLALALALLWLLWLAVRWLFDRLLFRIRSKLILSYLFIALVPVVLLGVFFTIAASFFLMLSASRLVRAQVERSEDLARAAAATALVDLPVGPGAAASLRERLQPVLALQPRSSWTLWRRGQVVAAEGGAPRELPAWWKGQPFSGLVRIDDGTKGPLSRAALRVVAARGDAALLLDLPLDGRLFADLERRVGIHVLQAEELHVVRKGSSGGRFHAERGVRIEYEEHGERVNASSGGGGLSFLALLPRVDWASGETRVDDLQALPFHLPAVDYVRRLAPEMLGAWRSMSDALLFALAVLGLVFLVLYAIALLFGLLLARSITYGVHALSLGTQKLRAGDFDYTIRVRSRDQLGELAASFNHMAAGLRQLVSEQAEKQRLEEELRIAREIQMSLLPVQGLLKLPGVRVAALCLPAAEVAATTTTCCRWARRGWGCWWPTSPARAPRRRSTWPS